MNKKALTITFCVTLFLFLLILSYKTTLYYSNLTTAQENTISFLKEEANLNLNYTAKEVSHLEDVKKVMSSINYFFYLSILIITLILTYYKRDQKQVKKLLKYGGTITLIIILLVLIISIISFSTAFTTFHQIFFPQGNWIFPADSLLIKTFPLEFFISISKRIFLQTLILGSFFILAASLLRDENSGQRN